MAERDLAKVEVVSSNLIARSISKPQTSVCGFFFSPFSARDTKPQAAECAVKICFAAEIAAAVFFAAKTETAREAAKD